MNNPTEKVPAVLLWRKAAQPILLKIQEPLPSEPVPTPEQVAAKQEWEHEGGAIKPPIVGGPKIPL